MSSANNFHFHIEFIFKGRSFMPIELINGKLHVSLYFREICLVVLGDFPPTFYLIIVK